MRARRLKPQTPDGFVRLLLPKGVVLVLTTEEYARAIGRGKAIRRAERQAAREQHAQAHREAHALRWLDTDRAV